VFPTDEYWLEVDEQGWLILPPEVREHYGIHPGAQIRLKEGLKSLHLQRPVTQLAKVYVEPISRCNLIYQNHYPFVECGPIPVSCDKAEKN
jgi:hypothetical protein